MDAQEKRRLEQIERRVHDGVPSGDPLLDSMTDLRPQPRAEYRFQLEERLVQQMQKQSIHNPTEMERISMQMTYNPSLRNQRAAGHSNTKRFTLALALPATMIATLAVVLSAAFFVAYGPGGSAPNEPPPSGSQPGALLAPVEQEPTAVPQPTATPISVGQPEGGDVLIQVEGVPAGSLEGMQTGMRLCRQEMQPGEELEQAFARCGYSQVPEVLFRQVLEINQLSEGNIQPGTVVMIPLLESAVGGVTPIDLQPTVVPPPDFLIQATMPRTGIVAEPLNVPLRLFTVQGVSPQAGDLIDIFAVIPVVGGSDPLNNLDGTGLMVNQVRLPRITQSQSASVLSANVAGDGTLNSLTLNLSAQDRAVLEWFLLNDVPMMLRIAA